MNIYELAYTDYEDYVPYLFLAPQPLDGDGWKKVCDDLLDAAAVTAVTAASAGEHKRWVGWPDVVEQVAVLLEAHAFTRLRPIAHSYFGSHIIREQRSNEASLPPPALELIVAHNRAVEVQVYGKALP